MRNRLCCFGLFRSRGGWGALGLAVLAVLAVAGCDRPFVEETEPALAVVAPSLASPFAADSITLYVRARTFRGIASVQVNGRALRLGADSLWAGRVGLSHGLTPLVIRATDVGGVAREETEYALRLSLSATAFSLGGARAGHAAVRLADGRVLVCGGLDRPGATARSDAFLVRFGAGAPVVEPVSGAMQHARAGHTATLLPDGRVLVAGGVRIDGRRDVGEIVSAIEIFDPARNRFEPAVARGAGLRAAYHQAFLTPGADGVPLLAVVGGEGPTTAAAAPRYGERSDARFFRIDPDGLTAVGTGAETGFGTNLGEPLAGFSATPLTDAAEQGRAAGTVLFGSDRAVAQGQRSVTPFGYAFERTATSATLRALATPPVARHRHGAARVAPGLVLIAGGAVDAATGTVPTAPEVLSGADLYAADAGRYFRLASAPGLRRYGHTVTALGGGKAFVFGGYESDGTVASSALVLDTGLP